MIPTSSQGTYFKLGFKICLCDYDVKKVLSALNRSHAWQRCQDLHEHLEFLSCHIFQHLHAPQHPRVTQTAQTC